MPLEIYPRESAFRYDAGSRAVLEYLRANQDQLAITEAAIFCNFPLFREEGEVLSVQIVLVCPHHGVLLIGTSDETQLAKLLEERATDVLDATFSQVFSRLVKYPLLRKARTSLGMNLDAVLFVPEIAASNQQIPDNVLVGLPALRAYIQKLQQEPLPPAVFAELVSVIDGSKALLRPPQRETENFGPQSKVVQIQALEEEIRRFDRDQRIGYMTEVNGTQRIRGLAGSGKTVVLAMKAALTAIRNPDATIAFTFYTKSLYQHVKQLITRFYRLYDDRDPDWDRVRVLHAWGGGIAEGLYSYAAKAFDERAMTLTEAKGFDSAQPFDFACRKLLENARVNSLFDYIFLDEAQDFPPSFLRLALRLANEERLVIAYDVLQTIFDVEIPTAGTLFGTDEHGEPAVTFEEDIILHKCYRNPREVLVTAHALGFGLYSKRIVQMLESKEHWEDFGYRVREGELSSGQRVVIERPRENSPSSISDRNSIDELVQATSFGRFEEEVSYVAAEIERDIKEHGVRPEDILVISADDRNARAYFQSISGSLAPMNIRCNNLQDDTFGIRDFQAKERVTLSTIYKAKGNEAFVVFVVGADALFMRPKAKSRNMVFTAMTRAKGWLRVSGIGMEAEQLAKEIKAAKAEFPKLTFVYPPAEELVLMKRDLSSASVEEVDAALDRLEDELPLEDYEAMLMRKLRDVRQRKRVKGPRTPRKGANATAKPSE